MRWIFNSRRHRTMSPLAMAIVGFVVGTLLVLGGIFMGSRGGDLDRMAASGERVTGQITQTRTEERRRRRNGHTRTETDYFISVKFTHPDGRPIQQERKVSSSVHSRYRGASISSPITTTVVINPADPGDWMVAEQLESKRQSAGLMMWILPVVGLLFFGMGAFGTVKHIKKKNAPPQMAQQYPPAYPLQQQGGPVPYGQPPSYPHPPGQQHPQQAGPNDNVIYDANQDNRRT